jgi:hypothetical protein
LRGFNPQSFSFLQINFPGLMLLYLAIACIAGALLLKNKTALFLGLSAACLFSILLCIDEYQALGQRKIVVYNISKANHVELIEGKNHLVIATDTGIKPKKKEYGLKAAYTGWHAWREKSGSQHEMYYINGKTVLVLNQAQKWQGTFPVDHLIVNYGARVEDILFLQHVFNPQELVLSPELSRKKERVWQETCKAQHIPLHSVMASGAYVWGSF